MLGLLLWDLFSIFLNVKFFRGCSLCFNFIFKPEVHPSCKRFPSHPNKTKQRLYFIVYLKMLQHLLPWLKELISFKPCFQVLCLVFRGFHLTISKSLHTQTIKLQTCPLYTFAKQHKQLQQGKNQSLAA